MTPHADANTWPPHVIEQYKVLESQLDSATRTQYGLWATGAAALGLFTGLRDGIALHVLLWTTGMVALLFTVLGWQLAINANGRRVALHRLFRSMDVPAEEQFTVVVNANRLAGMDRLRCAAELFLWPILLASTAEFGVCIGLAARANQPTNVMVALPILALAVGFGQGWRYWRSFWIESRVSRDAASRDAASRGAASRGAALSPPDLTKEGQELPARHA